MHRIVGLTLVGCLFILGCEGQSTSTSVAPADADQVVTAPAAAADASQATGTSPAPANANSQSAALQSGGDPVATTPAAADVTGNSKLVPVPLDGDAVNLNPSNAKIIFVGTHEPPKSPDPRTGGFEKFTGKILVDKGAKSLKSIAVEIDTNSLWTEFEKLTAHLKSPDFLEVREHPTIKFESTQIEHGKPGTNDVQITGNLTLHGVTNEIKLPAIAHVRDDGLTLNSQFSIDRMDYGIVFGPDQVTKTVALTVVVGEPTQARRSRGRPGG